MRKALYIFMLFSSASAMSEWGLVQETMEIQERCLANAQMDFEKLKKTLTSKDELSGQELCILTQSYHLTRDKCIAEFNNERNYASLPWGLSPHYFEKIHQSVSAQVKSKAVRTDEVVEALGGPWSPARWKAGEYALALKKCPDATQAKRHSPLPFVGVGHSDAASR